MDRRDPADALTTFSQTLAGLGSRPGPRQTLHIDPDPELGIDDTPMVTVCQVCNQQLNRLSTNIGDETWVHGRSWARFDHDPVPRSIRRDTLGDRICDFCGETARIHWSYVGAKLEQAAGNTNWDYGSVWSACQPCSVLIKLGDLEALLDRSTRNTILPRSSDPADIYAMRAQTLVMWSTFFSTVHTEKYVGPQREPAKLTPRMLPKLQLGLVKFWRSEGLRELLTRGLDRNGLDVVLPGVHCGDEDRFTVAFAADLAIPEPAWVNHVQHLTAGIEGGDLYWISENFTTLSIMAGKDFEQLEISREQLPSTFGFMVYETPIGEIIRPTGVGRIRAVTWTLVPQGIWINLYIQGEDGDPDADVELMRREMGYLICPNTGTGIRFNDPMPVPDDLDLDFLGTIFATWLLMSQPGVADHSSAPVDKKYARAYQRQYQRKLPDVRLVDLRKQPRRSKPAGGSGQPLTVRVYRKGHWKQQPWGPRGSLRRPKYISQYIAGPEGAPLKLPPPTVKVLR